MEMPTAEHGDVSGSFEQRDVREICLVAHIVLSRGAEGTAISHVQNEIRTSLSTCLPSAMSSFEIVSRCVFVVSLCPLQKKMEPLRCLLMCSVQRGENRLRLQREGPLLGTRSTQPIIIPVTTASCKRLPKVSMACDISRGVLREMSGRLWRCQARCTNTPTAVNRQQGVGRKWRR